jgi:hypothetical protein
MTDTLPQFRGNKTTGLGLSVAFHGLLLAAWLYYLPTAREVDPPAATPSVITLEPRIDAPTVRQIRARSAVVSSKASSPPSSLDALPPPPLAKLSPPSSLPKAQAAPSIDVGDDTSGASHSADNGRDRAAEPGRGGSFASASARTADDLAEAPHWILKPTAEQQLAVLPISVIQNETSGEAVLSCLVTTTNHVRDCRIVSETRVSQGFEGVYGFGEAAVRLSRTFLVQPPMRDGVPRFDIRVRIPVAWNWD